MSKKFKRGELLLDTTAGLNRTVKYRSKSPFTGRAYVQLCDVDGKSKGFFTYVSFENLQPIHQNSTDTGQQ